MAYSFEPLLLARSTLNQPKSIPILADICFEVFPLRELRRPHLIVEELQAAFPDYEEREILAAISMALHWKRLLRAAGSPLH